ncbi:hypothetical protein M3D75_06470 [Microbacterium enclense]|uniref:hypothetical protein n=1 Tax=Microbacterium enclense TaxID=993073 RepID=UPI0021A8EE2E|nr:hypothetical protein [Microbacterium enclense]MCT2085753.1 hypothetical protein [Microbacterium enclense]
MYDLTALFPPQERVDHAPSPNGSGTALGRLVGGARDDASQSSGFVGEGLARRVGPRESRSTEDMSADLARRVGPREPRKTEFAFAGLSRLTGPEAAMRRPGPGGDFAALSRRVGKPENVDERGWHAPELAKPGKRPFSNGRQTLSAVNLLSLAVAVVAVVILSATAGLALVQRITSDPAAEAMTTLREREAELQNETQVLATARGLYGASLSDASVLADAAGAIVVELEGILDRAALQPVERSRAALVAVIAGAPSIAVPEYRRPAIDDGSLDDIVVAIDKVRAAKEALVEPISEARASRSQVVASVDALKGELRATDSSIDVAAAEATRSNSAAADGFRSAVTDTAARVRAAHGSGSDGLTEMSAFAAAVRALRDENQRVLALQQSEVVDPVRPDPYVAPFVPEESGSTEPPPAGDTGGASDPDTGGAIDPGAGAGTPDPDPGQTPTPEPTVPPETGLPLPTP